MAVTLALSGVAENYKCSGVSAASVAEIQFLLNLFSFSLMLSLPRLDLPV